MGNGLASACIYRERSSRYGKHIKQWSSYTPYQVIIVTGYEPRLNALAIRNLSIIEAADICTRLASPPHSCTLVFKPQLL